MNPENVLFLFNPQSCSGKSSVVEKELRKKISQTWPGAGFIHTKAEAGFWHETAQKFSAAGNFIACGGDGTVHQAGNLAVKTGANLGIIPLGSGNDFAAMLGIPTDPWHALSHLKKAKIRKTDLLKIEGDMECYCLNTTGLGLDGLANRYTEIYKPFLGKAAYYSGAFRAALQSKSMRVQISVDGSEPELTHLLMITACNGYREGGRFVVAPDARIDDGKMDLLYIDPVKRLKRLILLPKFIKSFPAQSAILEQHQCRIVQLNFEEPVPVHVDGEYAGRYVQNLSISIEADALSVLG